MGDLSLATAQVQDEAAALQATFVPGAGMLCSSLLHRGEELLAQNAGVEAYARDGKTMGIPLLYPWANRLAGFQYSLAGRSVHVPRDTSRVAVDQNGLPIHGVIGGRLGWELITEPTTDMRSLAEGYPCAQVFAPRTGHFICFEPMAAPTNALASGGGLKLLDPGERYTAGFSVSVQDLARASLV
jgi:galactose mutarotase-like enzyme